MAVRHLGHGSAPLFRRREVLDRAVFLLSMGMLCGCGNDPSEGIYGEWSVERESRGDTLVVRTVAGSIWRDTMQLVPELSIGTLDGDAYYVFGEVASIDLDSDGQIFVLDSQAREIRVFSPDGEHIRSMGRSGSGPGEFNRPIHIRVTPDGRIVVKDEMAARFSVLSDEGVYLSGWPRGSTHSSWFPFFFDSDGRVINQSLSDKLVRYELSGNVVDTIDIPGREVPIPRIEIVTSNSRTSFYVPFAPGNHWGVTWNGSFIYGFGGEYRFEWVEADGSVVRVERDSQGAPVVPEEANRMREDYTRMIRSEYGVPDWQWNGPDIPKTKPAFDRILPGRDGTVWLLRATASEEVENPNWDPEQPESGSPTMWSSSAVADVFDEDGRYLGPVKIPDGVVWQPTLPVLTEDAVWALVITSIGVPQVVRFRLEPATGS